MRTLANVLGWIASALFAVSIISIAGLMFTDTTDINGNPLALSRIAWLSLLVALIGVALAAPPLWRGKVRIRTTVFRWTALATALLFVWTAPVVTGSVTVTLPTDDSVLAD